MDTNPLRRAVRNLVANVEKLEAAIKAQRKANRLRKTRRAQRDRTSEPVAYTPLDIPQITCATSWLSDLVAEVVWRVNWVTKLIETARRHAEGRKW